MWTTSRPATGRTGSWRRASRPLLSGEASAALLAAATRVEWSKQQQHVAITMSSFETRTNLCARVEWEVHAEERFRKRLSGGANKHSSLVG